MTFGWTTQAQRRQYRAMAVSTFLMAMIAPLSPADANAVSAVEMGDREITIRFDDVVEKASSFVLAGPDRIAIDVTGAEPGAPVSPIGVIRSVRQGRPDANTARIVFDLAEPAVISGGQFAADGRSLTLSVDPAADDDFSAAAKAARKLYLPPIA